MLATPPRATGHYTQEFKRERELINLWTCSLPFRDDAVTGYVSGPEGIPPGCGLKSRVGGSNVGTNRQNAGELLKSRASSMEVRRLRKSRGQAGRNIKRASETCEV